MSYLEDPVKKYGCQMTTDENAISFIPNGYSYSPFVELKVGDEIVTVGNNSRPGKGNTAIIKSFEYGVSEGQGCKIEVLDEEGGSFTKAFQGLSKSIKDTEKDMRAFELDFGWIIERNCGIPHVQKIAASNSGNLCSGKIILLPMRANVSYEGGKIKYQIEAIDGMARVGEARVECNIGTDDKKVELKQAITELFTNKRGGPNCKVEFLSADGQKDFEFDKKYGGPKGVWVSNQQNKLATARRWINPYTTTNGKGIILQWKGCQDPSAPATIVFMEDPSPSCGQKIDPCQTNISRFTGQAGTYVVNGGPASSVISFNPTVQWHLTPLGKTGGQQSAVDGGGSKASGVENCPDGDKREKAGATTGGGSGGLISGVSPEESSKEAANGSAAHQKANIIREAMNSIEAELRIFGDPSLVHPILLAGNKSVSLIVINPFHIKNSSAEECGDWLARPVCNEVFSNKNWIILGVNHQISAGSYVTTLKLKLPVPGVEINPDANAPLGGPDSGGYSAIFNSVSSDKQDEIRCEVK